jgi:hypothetical protein
MARAIILGSLLAAAATGLPTGTLPAGADSISIGVNIGSPPPPPVVVTAPPQPVVVTAPPQLVVVPGTPVLYAPDVDVSYFAYGGRHYTYQGDVWFVASTYRGPWMLIAVERVPKPVLAVPVTYHKVPPGHAKRHGGHRKGKHKWKDD